MRSDAITGCILMSIFARILNENALDRRLVRLNRRLQLLRAVITAPRSLESICSALLDKPRIFLERAGEPFVRLSRHACGRSHSCLLSHRGPVRQSSPGSFGDERARSAGCAVNDPIQGFWSRRTTCECG